MSTCYLRFVVWDPVNAHFRGVPPGLEVAVIDGRGIRRDRPIGQGVVGEDGCAEVVLEEDGTGPFHVETRVPDGTPRHIRRSPAWTWSKRGAHTIPVPRKWSSREVTAVERPNRAGQWEEDDGIRVGRPEAPWVFELGPSRPRLLPGNRARPLIDGPQTLRRMEQLIAGATRSVHIQMMLWFDDAIGRRIVDCLVAKAAQGVPVRVLLDRDTTEDTHTLTALHATWVKWLRTVEEPEKSALLAQIAKDVAADEARGDLSTLVRKLRQAEGVSLRITSFPKVFVRTQPDGPLPPAYAALSDARPWFNVARIDHRKMLVIDGKTAVIGGMNIGREYLHEVPFDPMRRAAEEPWHKWHDVMVALSGPCVRPIQHLFRERWVEEGGPRFELGPRSDGRGLDPEHPTFPALSTAPDGLPVRIVSTTPGARSDLRRAYLSLMARARERLLIQMPYFSSEEAREAILAAARRGVRVVLVLPDDHNDSVDFRYAARLHYAELMEAGVEVYEYQGRMTHTKVMVSDAVTVVGSANLNRTSFERHYEVSAIIHDAAFTADFVRKVFAVDLPRSRRLHPEDLEELIDLNAVGRWWCRNLVDRFF